MSYQPFIEKPVKTPVEGLTPLGDKTYRKTRYFIDEDGERQAEPGDEFNLDAYIQASAAATDLAVIYQKFMDGDETVVNVGSGIYGDMTQLPTDINDVVASKKIIDTASKSFDSLPDEVKQLFNNDVNEYFNKVLENKAQSIVKEYLESKKHVDEQPAQEDVK